MKAMKAISSILIVGAMTGQLVSQETTTAANQHQKKVYVDSTNKIFWPLDKPFWIRVAESPDNNAASYLLTRDSDSTKAPPGIRLDCTGTQTVSWFNSLSGGTEKLRFAADGEPPRASLSLLGPNPFIKPGTAPKGGPFYGKGLVAKLTAEDRHSGVEHILLSINNAAFASSGGDIAFTQEGRYTLAYYGVDRVGNASYPAKTAFSVDISAPATVALSNGKPVENGSMLSPAQSIVLTASDTLSGVKECLYKIDNQKFAPLTGPIALSSLTGDKHAIAFYAVDNVGNTEAPRTVEFSIDNEPPSAAVAFEGDRYAPQAGIEFISPRTAVRINGNDGKSGLDRIEFKMGGDKYSPYTGPFSVLPQAGACAVDARAFDKAGNVSPVCRASVKMDSRPPKSRLAFAGPAYGNNTGTTITPETKITLTASDNESGVKAIRCRVGGGEEVAYSAPLVISGEGAHVVKYWSIDNVNNREDTQSVTLSVDNTPPKIIETFSVENAGAGAQKVLKFPPSTMLFLAASDASGVEGIWYSVNGKQKVKYEGNLRFEAKGKYGVLLSARDNLGKTNEKMVFFEIGD